ncbi:MAG: AbrB/MazE/SpoVT family DNA-binding domain-containing protein [Candidatus Micrarchaeaceae archaeon]
MVKVFKKDNKYIIYIPYEVVNQLRISQDDEVDFFRFSNTAFLFAKKADVASLITSTASSPAKRIKIEIAPEELAVLKKLDTLRYPVRTEANVLKLLNNSEKRVLDKLIERKLVALFNDEKRKEKLYSISKYVYDNFLMRKKPVQQQVSAEEVDQARAWGEVEAPMAKPNIDNKDISALEKYGYVVIGTEAEAAALSLAMADSIRQGQVIGVRAFNKKYYIMLRSFFEKNSAKLVKELNNGPKTIAELSNALSADPDALRGMLYLMAEQGDVTENRKDVFALVS